MEETQSENKLFNIFLLGDIKSEKNKIIQQYILNNNEENIELEKENNKNESELTQSFEIHGETIRMKILEVSQIDQIFHSEKENSSQTHGILLFCNVSDRDSFDKLKEIISKIFDMNKYEIPIVLVGNNTNESQRKVSYEEAKNFSDNYGLKYYETSMENNFIKMKDIFRDLGEQVLYQDNDSRHHAHMRDGGFVLSWKFGYEPGRCHKVLHGKRRRTFEDYNHHNRKDKGTEDFNCSTCRRSTVVRRMHYAGIVQKSHG